MKRNTKINETLFNTWFIISLIVSCSASCRSFNLIQEVTADTKETMQVLFFTSDNCPPCLRMKKNVWPNTEVQRSVKQYHCSPRMLNSSNEKNIAYFKYYNIRYVPTTIICDRYGGELKRKVGYIRVKEMLHFLVQLLDNKLLIHEFKELHLLRLIASKTKADFPEETETRVYLDEETTEIIIYQYKFKSDKVIDINSVHLTLRQFAILTKDIFKTYVASALGY